MLLHTTLLSMSSPNTGVTCLWEPNYKKKTPHPYIAENPIPAHFAPLEGYPNSWNSFWASANHSGQSDTSTRPSTLVVRAEEARGLQSLRRHRWTPGHTVVKTPYSPAAQSAASVPTSHPRPDKKASVLPYCWRIQKFKSCPQLRQISHLISSSVHHAEQHSGLLQACEAKRVLWAGQHRRGKSIQIHEEDG